MAKQNEIAVLAKQLQDPVVAGDDFQSRILLSRVLSYVSQGEDCSQLLPSLVKRLAHRDLCVKKMAGEALIHQGSHNSHMVLLAINCLVQDTAESNPLIRGLALKTLSSLQQDCVPEHLERIMGAALSDKSAYVRRAAVLACVKLHQMSPSSVKDTDLVDTLYEMIRDSDPIVVTNCLAALDEILREEGGVVINKAIARYLLSKLNTFPTWSLVQVVTVLKKYNPACDDELFNIMNVTDSCLENNSSTVVLACIELFLHLLRSLPHLQSEVFKRSQVTLVTHLASNNVEVSYAILDTISKASDLALPHFCSSVRSFFCCNRDPLYLKLKKISLLPQLITEENGEAVLEELSLYCVSNCEEVSFHAIQAVRLAYQRKSFLSEACVTVFMNLMDTSSLSVLSNLILVLQSVQINHGKFWKKLISPLTRNFFSFTVKGAKAAALYLIGQHMRDSDEAFTVIEKCVEDFQDQDDGNVKQQLLTATTKMFLSHPCELQSLLGGLLEGAMKDRDVEVRSRAEFLYRLLEKGLDTTRLVLLGDERSGGKRLGHHQACSSW